ncbi:MAG: LptF/LptG family permease [Spirochaetales bacterium]|nr:LptF/LptG family permease [Spirochaetales bacterium]
MRREGRARYGKVSRYIAVEFLSSFGVAFAFFFVVFFVNQLLVMASDILESKAPPGQVLLLVFYATPAIIAMSVPFASLVGALMAIGRFSSDRELLVMEASGIPRSRVYLPMVVLGLLFSVISFGANDVLLPVGTINYGKLYRRLATTTPALELGAWTIKRYEDATIVTGPVEGDWLRDVLIMDRTEDGKARVIGAERARLGVPEDPAAALVLELEGVFIQTTDAGRPDRFDFAEASSLDYTVAVKQVSDGSRAAGPREMSSVDVALAIRAKEESFLKRIEAREREVEDRRAEALEKYRLALESGESGRSALTRLGPRSEELERLASEPPTDRSLRVYRMEFWKKFSIPAGAFFFVFLAAPLGTLARRSGRAVGFALGLLVAVVYWGLLSGGSLVSTRLDASPFWSMWAPNIAVLAGAIALAIGRRALRR